MDCQERVREDRVGEREREREREMNGSIHDVQSINCVGQYLDVCCIICFLFPSTVGLGGSKWLWLKSRDLVSNHISWKH